MTKVAIFVRVSKLTQDYTRQISDLQAYAAGRNYQVVEIISEKISGAKKNEERVGIQQLLQLARKGKINKVLTSEISRLGRNSKENYDLLHELSNLKVSIYSQDMGMETLTTDGKLSVVAEILYTVFSSIYRQERERLIERINSGLDEAKRKGKTLGRPTGTTKSAEKLLKENQQIVRKINEGLSIRDIAKICACGTAKVQRVKKALSVCKPNCPIPS